MLRRTVYVGSLMAAGALIDELTYFLLTRHPLHLADRGVRLLDRVRDAARL
jgi:hypothetical protein